MYPEALPFRNVDRLTAQRIGVLAEPTKRQFANGASCHPRLEIAEEELPVVHLDPKVAFGMALALADNLRDDP